MRVYRTDRERRMLGDRLATLRKLFAAVHPAVLPAFEAFVARHHDLFVVVDLRLREQAEDVTARADRDTAFDAGLQYYGWAYKEVPRLLQGSWRQAVDLELEQEVRGRLFPLGTPTAAGASEQLMLDGLTHLLNGLAREKELALPPAFVAELTAARDELGKALAVATVERAETRAAEVKHQQVREAWDRHYSGLRSVTQGYLRQADRAEEIDRLFSVLPERAAAGAGDSTDSGPAAATTDSADSATTPEPTKDD